LPQVDILSRYLGSILLEPIGEPTGEPIKRSTFQDARRAIEGQYGMVCKEKVAGFTIDAMVGSSMSFVF
jgi:hypothetical protein